MHDLTETFKITRVLTLLFCGVQGGARGSYERAVKLCYGLSILGSVPLVILPFYNLILPLVGYDASWWVTLMATLCPDALVPHLDLVTRMPVGPSDLISSASSL